MEDLQLVVATLKEKFQKNQWFHDVVLDRYNRPVVYVYELTREIDEAVPQTLGGRQVLVHWASSLIFKKEQFVSNGTEAAISLVKVKAEELPSSDLELDLSDLTLTLDSLEKICGSNILQDIFYEVHDGPNSVTNLSARHPEVREALNKLYDEFGFDIIYEELDG